MAAENKTTQKLEEMLDKVKGEYSENKAKDDLNRANDFYNKMVDEGTIQKRGYTLRGIEDPYPAAMYLKGQNDFRL